MEEEPAQTGRDTLTGPDLKYNLSFPLVNLSRLHVRSCSFKKPTNPWLSHHFRADPTISFSKKWVPNAALQT